LVEADGATADGVDDNGIAPRDPTFCVRGRQVEIALVRGKISPPDKSSSVWFPPMAYSFADRVSPKVQNDWACAAILRRRNRSRSPAYASSAARSAAETVPSVG